MKVSDLSRTDLAEICAASLILTTGPFSIAFSATDKHFLDSFYHLYQDYDIFIQEKFSDFNIKLVRPKNFHLFFHSQIQFLLEGKSVFNPLPMDQVFPVFEWGLNWCIGNACNYFLVIHAGVLEKNGQGILLPGIPGAGKSTICAALSLKGWRLLSDELALIDLNTGECAPLARPVSLKDKSINLIANYSPEAVLSETVHDTQKGSVAYLKVPALSVEKMAEPIRLKKIIFPQFQPSLHSVKIESISKARAFIRIADQSFNYHILGLTGFNLLKKVLQDCDCYEFDYNGCLDEVESVFNSLIRD